MSTASVTKFSEDTVVVSAMISDDFLNKVIELSKEGYSIVSNTSQFTRLSRQVCMTKNEALVSDTPEVPSEPLEAPVEEITENPVGEPTLEAEKPVEGNTEESRKHVRLRSLSTFKGDKDALEEYGMTFGIDLKKNKSIKNMYKDLQEHVKK